MTADIASRNLGYLFNQWLSFVHLVKPRNIPTFAACSDFVTQSNLWTVRPARCLTMASI